jgi:hypothetical protein
MPKSASDLVEEILQKCNPPDNMSAESEVKVRDYIRQHINAIKHQAAIVINRTDDKFVSDMGLSRNEGKAFLDRVNSELGKIHRSDIAQEGP